MTASFMRLLEEHDAIDRAANAVLALVATAPSPAEAKARLDALATCITDHVAYEDGFIYPELERTVNEQLSEAAEQFASEFVALRDDWVDYLDSWPGDAIAGDWEGFGSATRTMLPRMLDRIRRENECLYPLALRRGAISLR